MPFDTKKWRSAVRAAFDDGTANRFGSGPWLPESWYDLGWNIWKKGGMILEITEERMDTRVTESGPAHGSGPRSRSEWVITETFHFLAEVTPADLWRGPPLAAPSGSSIWWHGSRTAFGPGLYHCEGYISLRGTQTTTSKIVLSSTPADGGPTETSTISDVTHTAPHAVVMEYATVPADLDGLNTFCRIIVKQTLPPVAAFYFNPTLWFHQPSDPDGNISRPDLVPPELREEVYWTDAALADLAGGGWTKTMDLIGDSMTVGHGPNEDGIDNGGFDSETWSRSGMLALVAV